MGWMDDEKNDWNYSRTTSQGHRVNGSGYDKYGNNWNQDDYAKKNNSSSVSLPHSTGNGSGFNFLFVLIAIPILITIIVTFIKDARVYIISIAGVIIFFTALFLLLRRFHVNKLIQYGAVILGVISLVLTFALLGRYSKLRVYPVMFEYSLVQKLEDGTAPQLYRLTSIYADRKPIGPLVPDEMVTVLGNTKRGQNFKIKTISGKTGYVDPSALLPDIHPGVESFISKVLYGEDKNFKWLQRTALPLSNAMGQKNGRITRIDYNDEYTTLVIVNTGKEKIFTDDIIIGPGSADAYHVYDLESSKIYKLKAKGYSFNGVYLVFEPFSSRHFDLIAGNRQNDEWNFLDVRVPEK